MSGRKVLFDTDPGVDDAMALLFLDAAPQLELAGITTAVGNHSVETTTRNALYICQRFGIDTPVHRGAGAALVVEPDEHPTFVHGDDGLGNIHVPTPPLSDAGENAARFMVERILAEPGELTIVAVGRLTNLALALQLEPRIADLVAEVIIMGGALGSNQHTGQRHASGRSQYLWRSTRCGYGLYRGLASGAGGTGCNYELHPVFRSPASAVRAHGRCRPLHLGHIATL